MSKFLSKLSFTLLLLLASLNLSSFAVAATDSKGKEFVVTFPPNLSNEGHRSLFISSESTASGTISISGLSYTTPFNVNAGEVTRVDLPLSVELLATGSVSNLGVRIVADEEITVYGLNQRTASTDAYLALPVDTLGVEYIATSYTPLSNYSIPAQLTIIGVYDNTQVIITPSASSGNQTPIELTLNRDQVYYLESMQETTGTQIKSSAPVGVLSGTQCSFVPINYRACDHLVEMIPPAATWGKQFLTQPLATRLNGDIFRILASAENTQVTIDGVVVAMLNQGEFFETVLQSSSIIETSEPALLTQFSASSNFDNVTSDPFMMIVPPSEQFLSNYSFTTLGQDVGFVNSFVNVVIPTEDISGLKLNGANVDAALFQPIGQSGFSGAQINVPAGSHQIQADVPFGIYVYGFGSYDSYGYTGGMAFEFINPKGDSFKPNVKLALLGETAQGVAGDSEDINLNGILDPGEDLNQNGQIDRRNEDINGDEVLDADEDLNQDGIIDVDTGIFKIELSGDSTNLRLETNDFVPGALTVDFFVHLIDSSAPGAGTVIISDGAGNRTEQPVSLSNVPIMTQVKVISTVSTIDIDLDSSSFAKQPDRIEALAESTILEWHFDNFSVAQAENLDYQLVLKSPLPNETRLVTHSLVLEYTNFDGTLIRKELGDQQIKVAQSAFDLDATTDKSIYIAGEQVVIDGSVLNLSEFPADAQVMLSIVDAQGVKVTTLVEMTVSQLAQGASLPIDTQRFSTSDVFVGDYTLVAVLSDGYNGVPIEVTKDFQVTTENGALANVVSRITTDQVSYRPWDKVTLETLVENIAKRSQVEGATGFLKLIGPNNEVVLEQAQALTTLIASLQLSNQFMQQLDDASLGEYTAVWEIRSAENELLSASATAFTVNSTLQDRVLGKAAIDHPSVYYSQDNHCRFETVNRGAEEVSSLPVRYQLIRMADDLVIETQQTELSYAGKQTHTFIMPIETKMNTGSYACVLQAQFQSGWQTLSADTFELEIDVELGEKLGKVLVLQDAADVDAPDPNGPASLLATQNQNLMAALEAGHWGYQFTDNVIDFVNELNSGQYDAYLILAEQQMLDQEAQNLLKYAVFVGDGLYVSNSSLEGLNTLQAVLGIELAKAQPEVKSISLNHGVLPSVTEQLLAYQDVAYSFHPVEAEVAGVYQLSDSEQLWQYDNGVTCMVSSEPPAVALNRFGFGDGVYSGFDLVAQANSTQPYFTELLGAVIESVHPDLYALPLNRAASLTLSVGASQSPIPGRLVVQLPAGVELVNPGALVESDGVLAWNFDLSQKLQQQTTLELRGVSVGEHQLVTQLELGADGDYQFQQQRELTLNVVAELASLALIDSQLNEQILLEPRNVHLKFAHRAVLQAKALESNADRVAAAQKLDKATEHLEQSELALDELKQMVAQVRLGLTRL